MVKTGRGAVRFVRRRLGLSFFTDTHGRLRSGHGGEEDEHKAAGSVGMMDWWFVTRRSRRGRGFVPEATSWLLPDRGAEVDCTKRSRQMPPRPAVDDRFDVLAADAERPGEVGNLDTPGPEPADFLDLLLGAS
jgi:hypothetical protein